MNRKKFEKKRLAAALLAVLLLLTMATPTLAETFSAIVTSSSMTVYKDASMSKRLGTLGKNTVVRITAYSGRAAKVKYAGKTGYALISDMKSVEEIAVKAVTTDAADVYQSASVASRSVKVQAGTRLFVLAKSGGWAMVEKDGAVGYMNASLLAKADDSWETPSATATAAPTQTPAASGIQGTVTASKLTVYKSASTKAAKLGTLKKGQTVNVVDWRNNWAYIELNGRYGYCSTKSLNLTDADPAATPTPAPTALTYTATITVSTLPVYQKASASAAKLGTMKQGQQLNVLATSGGWAYVELNGRYGYCAADGLTAADDAVTPTPTVAPTATPSIEGAAKGTVAVTTLDVYKTASTASARLGALKKGQEVNVIKWNDTWAFIELNGNYGFCAVIGLTRTTDVAPTAMPTATPSTENAVQAVVVSDTLNVYKLAGETSDVLGRLKKSQVVNVLSISGDWAYIELAGNYGFCLLSALKLDDKPAVPSEFAEGGFSATVIFPGARAYATASASADSVSLTLGATVNVYAYSGEWACIVNGSTYAFVPVRQLSRNSYSTISGDGSDLQTLLKTLLSYGYYDGVPSTSYNSLATAAIKRFQAACGLEETGVADQALQRILYGGYAPASPILSAALSQGSGGESVTRLQTRLYALGYLSKAGSVDGDYGATTASAVGLFQTANGITATGSATTDTLKAVYAADAVSKPSGVKAADDGASGGGSVVSPTGTVKLSSTYVTTMPAALKSNTSSYSSSMSNAQKLEHAIYNAQVNLGKPYVYGATGPNSFDCSGLTVYSFKKIGVSLKRSAYSQGYDSSYTKISGVSNLKRGDLVFFNTISDSDLSDHVGIYLGGGCFIHASSGGHKVVVSNITSGYYNRVFSWGRRILS